MIYEINKTRKDLITNQNEDNLWFQKTDVR